MFTIEQVKEAHAKVKSGADFPAYVREIGALGVTYYETYVADGHTRYHGANGYTVTSPARYETLVIAGQPATENFALALKEHQQGKTDYATFCRASADSGVEKWEVCLDKKTCTYFDKTGAVVLTEAIPG